MNQTIRVRFAPSPTGFLHIGGVRTALFNYLFARKKGGMFLVRIEDTDQERSRHEFEDEILESLKWLGLDWDGDVFRQSQRVSAYQDAIRCLIRAGFAYRVEENGRSAVKFKVPKQMIHFCDLIHGPIEFDGALLDDFVIQKSDGFPTYHFACVVDDHEMEISHVIRGDDHISNTPKQLLIYYAFGWDTPQFAHVPLIFDQDHTPLSKRHGAVSLTAYRNEGFLPEGILNYLALLGWSAGQNREIFGREDLIQFFSLEAVNKTNACFDQEKLRWMNAEHMRRLSDQDYIDRLRKFLPGVPFSGHKRFSEIALLYKSRIQTFQEFSKQAGFFFSDQVAFDPQAVRKHLSNEKTHQQLVEWYKVLDRGGDFSNPQALEQLLRSTAEHLSIDARALIHSTRVAISGRLVTPGLFETMVLLGKEVVLERIQYVIINLTKLGA